MFNDTMYTPNHSHPTSQEVAMRARAKEHQMALLMARYQKNEHSRNNRGLRHLLASLLTGLR